MLFFERVRIACNQTPAELVGACWLQDLRDNSRATQLLEAEVVRGNDFCTSPKASGALRASCTHSLTKASVNAVISREARLGAECPLQVDVEDLLLVRWREGDPAAGDELVRMCKPILRAFFRRRTNDNVDDLMQRTLVACIQALDRFEGRSSFKSFLLGIAHRQFLANLRSNRLRELPPTLHVPSDDSPSQLLVNKEDVRAVAAALNDTAPAFRRVLEMFYWEDLSVEEIARALDLPVGTVKSRLARGRSMIKARMMRVGRSKSGEYVIRKRPKSLLLVEHSSTALAADSPRRARHKPEDEYRVSPQ